MISDPESNEIRPETVKIKICGITNVPDALAATEAGADFLGFIFYPPSKRATTAEDVRQIRAELNKLPRRPVLVGVFVNETAETMAQVLDSCRLDLAQLSGQEPPSLIGDPASPLYGRSFKALRPQSLEEALSDAEWYAPPEPDPAQPTLLLDAYHPTLWGGSGIKTDWLLATRLTQTVARLMLAGGLTPDNVAQAVGRVRPYAVDVASGVETRPGVKDHEAIRAFISAARSPFRGSFS